MRQLLFLATAALLLTGGFACGDPDSVTDNENFRADVIQCENAVSHAEACCASLRAPAQACVHHYMRSTTDCGCSGGGDSHHEESTTPVFDEATSDAISRTSCEDLAAAGGCERLDEQFAKKNDTSITQGSCNQGSSVL